MIRISIFTLFFLTLFIQSNAQPRYLAQIYDDISVETHTYASKNGENLELDLYTPTLNEEIKRPLLIYVHGGGFSGGRRDLERIKEFCTNVSSYGYIVASISYRLTRKDKKTGFGCNCPETEKRNAIQAASEDLMDATYYLIENREAFGLEPQQIILAGSSAGAETVLNTAYQPPFCYGLDSGPVSYAGVIGMAGAITDTAAIYPESAIPSLLFHGTNDNLVPYGTAPHHYCDKNDDGYLLLHGSYTIAQKLNRLNIPCWLHTSCGGGHELASKPLTDFFDEIIDFCYNFVLKKNGDTRHTIVKGEQNTEKFETYNFCEE